MSHGELRKEKDCLNCGTEVQGPYCHKCGQENIVPHETFGSMVKHFFYDITHFDGNFFSTLKILLFKPGFLSIEYIKGKRKAFLHPIRMYVFTSAVFFLTFFSLYSIKESDIEILDDKEKVSQEATELKEELLKDAKNKNDSLKIEKAANLIGIADSSLTDPKDSSKVINAKAGDRKMSMDFGDASKYNSVHEYDSIQKTLAKKDQDGFFSRILNRKFVVVNERYKGKENKLFSDVLNTFFHTFPYLLFVSLPLYALFLKLLYIRRKQFFYADHGIFLIHLYIFSFLFLLVFFLLNKINEMTSLGFIDAVLGVFILAGLFYTLKALKNFYQQGWSKTITKFILFNMLCTVAALILFVIFLMVSVFQI